MQTRAGIKAGQGAAGPHLSCRVGKQREDHTGKRCSKEPSVRGGACKAGGDGEGQTEDEGKGTDVGCEGRSLEG